MASHSVEAQAASATQAMGAVRRRSAAASSGRRRRRRVSVAVSARRTAARGKRDQYAIWRPVERKGSMANGYASSASNEAALESANSLYGKCRPREAASHDCKSGLVADSAKYGSPTDDASRSRIAAVGLPPVASGRRLTAVRTAERQHPEMRQRLCLGSEISREAEGVEISQSRTTWKNSMQVIQTEAEPPNRGRSDLAIIGWTTKSRAELSATVPA